MQIEIDKFMYYNQFVEKHIRKIKKKSQLEKKLVYSILSIRTNTDKVNKAIEQLNNIDFFEKYQYDLKVWASLDKILKENTISYYNQKFDAIYLNLTSFNKIKEILPDDMPENYKKQIKLVQKLKKQLKFVGNAKTRFFLCLTYPQEAKICCLDSQMLKLWHNRGEINKIQRKLSKNDKLYQEYEKQIIELAKILKKPIFEVQWTLWNTIREKDEKFEVLWG